MFSFLKKIFGCGDNALAADDQKVESGRSRGGRGRGRRPEFREKRDGGRKSPRRHSFRQQSEQPELQSNLSPEQQKEALDKLNAFVLHVARSLVDFPDQVSTEFVAAEESNGGTSIVISCAQGDAGKLIGRSGRIISSIRLLVNGNAAARGMRVSVDIKD